MFVLKSVTGMDTVNDGLVNLEVWVCLLTIMITIYSLVRG